MSDDAVFIGEREHALDAKGRVIIPSKFREEISEARDGRAFYLTIGLGQCLFVYTEKRWRDLAQRIAAQPFTQQKTREFQRLFFGSAERVEPDKTGRILVSEHLRLYAGLKVDVVMVGVSDRIEVWDADTWKASKKKNYPLYEKLAEDLFGAGQ